MGNRYKFSVDVSATNSKVSGSCIPVRVHRPEGNIQFLVDVGLHQGEDDCELNNRAQFKFKPENVEFVLLTHVHADHSGRYHFCLNVEPTPLCTAPLTLVLCCLLL